MKKKIIISLLVLLILAVFTGNVFAYTLTLPKNQGDTYTYYEEKMTSNSIINTINYIEGTKDYKAYVKVQKYSDIDVSSWYLQYEDSTKYLSNPVSIHTNIRLKFINYADRDYACDISGSWDPR